MCQAFDELSTCPVHTPPVVLHCRTPSPLATLQSISGFSCWMDLPFTSVLVHSILVGVRCPFLYSVHFSNFACLLLGAGLVVQCVKSKKFQ